MCACTHIPCLSDLPLNLEMPRAKAPCRPEAQRVLELPGPSLAVTEGNTSYMVGKNLIFPSLQPQHQERKGNSSCLLHRQEQARC